MINGCLSTGHTLQDPSGNYADGHIVMIRVHQTAAYGTFCGLEKTWRNGGFRG